MLSSNALSKLNPKCMPTFHCYKNNYVIVTYRLGWLEAFFGPGNLLLTSFGDLLRPVYDFQNINFA